MRDSPLQHEAGGSASRRTDEEQGERGAEEELAEDELWFLDFIPA